MTFTRWFFLIFLLSNTVAMADAIKIIGNIEQSINQSNTQRLNTQSAPKTIALLHLELSNKTQQTIGRRIEKTLEKNTAPLSMPNYPRQLQLGMNRVPVLNQGSHGTCVTFANTAAIDAALNKGDYISQLCQLQLGRYLENNTYTSSGWNGSWGRIILNQMDVFGIVNKERQRAEGCGGLTEYPLNGDGESSTELSLLTYHQLSEPMPQNLIAWSSVLEVYQIESDKTDTYKTLMDVKMALNAGDRLTFGVLLLDFDQGVVGAVGTHQAQNDSWILTPEIAKDINDQAQFAGHEMVITGYDDDAIATDDQGRKYRGLLTLRNSWGENIGNKGDFYMSYTYFRALVLEAQRIRILKPTEIVL